MLLEGMLASVVAPAAIDLIKNSFGALTKKWVGLSVDDEIRLQSADIERLKALAQLDTPGGSPSQWVVDLRASSRYIAIGVSILVGTSILIWFPGLADIGAQLIGIPFSFLFGERMYLSIKGK